MDLSRVMSLVPPKELGDLLANVSSGPLPTSASTEIGRLVTEGFQAWSAFDTKYRDRAEEIRAISPGAATWNDFARFLLKFGDASQGPDVKVTAFDFDNDEIVGVDEQLPALRLEGQLFACGDTGGLPPDPVDGVLVRPIGLNMPEVANRLKGTFAPPRPAGAAYLRRPSELDSLLGEQGPIAIIGLLRQTIQQELGRVTERGLALYLYVVGSDGEARLLDEVQRAAVVRACIGGVRLRDPTENQPVRNLVDLEGTLAQSLRRPTSDEVEAGLRHVVWPISAMMLV